MARLLERLLNLAIRKIIDKYSGPTLKVEMSDYFRILLSEHRGDELYKELSRSYGNEKLSHSFSDSLYLVTDSLEIIKPHTRSIDELIDYTYEDNVRLIGAIREWPTIPPHFMASDFILASEINLRALISFSRIGNEVHVLAMKGDWSKCLQVRRYVVERIIEVAERFVPKLSEEKLTYVSEIDEIPIKYGTLRIYPEVFDSKKWKEVLNLITMAYLGATEFPQYILFRLI
ncbi:MAG: hypothetical protein ACTSVA_00580 [Candidatus Njordarchaeales archaeon]